MFSVQLRTCCRVFELKDQLVAGGPPPRGPDTVKSLVNKSPPLHSPAPRRGLQTAQGAAVLASGARISIFPAHTHSLFLPLWT